MVLSMVRKKMTIGSSNLIFRLKGLASFEGNFILEAGLFLILMVPFKCDQEEHLQGKCCMIEMAFESLDTIEF